MPNNENPAKGKALAILAIAAIALVLGTVAFAWIRSIVGL